MTDAQIEAAFARHVHVGFQFSGGRDSTAALFRLRPWWHRMTVYHLDTGDQFPETRAVVRAVARHVPVQVINTDVQAVREQHGLPSDLIPINNHTLGRATTGEPLKIVDRYECCARALMIPMHERMLADGITLIVRGQRADEFHKAPTRSGDTDGRVELLFPIEDWTAADVDGYIAAHGLPVAPFYAAGLPEAPECMGCTAWWGDGRLGYLRQHHPVKFAEVRAKTQAIRAAIDRQYATLDDKENDHG
jgi:phosphoadenosine phosphosulfate reductase